MGKKMGFIALLMALLWSPAVVSELSAEGEVSFLAVRKFEVGAGPGSVAVGDFNGDAIEDLAVTNVESNDVSILLNDTAVSGEPPLCLGDVDGDGERDTEDVVKSRKHILGREELTGTALENADVNQDGTVDFLNVVRLGLHIRGMAPLPECG